MSTENETDDAIAQAIAHVAHSAADGRDVLLTAEESRALRRHMDDQYERIAAQQDALEDIANSRRWHDPDGRSQSLENLVAMMRIRARVALSPTMSDP